MLLNSPYFQSIYVFWLNWPFYSRLFWPWCIYASCCTRTGRSWYVQCKAFAAASEFIWNRWAP